MSHVHGYSPTQMSAAGEGARGLRYCPAYARLFPDLPHTSRAFQWSQGQTLPSQLLQVLGLALFLTLGTLVILIFPPMFFSHVEGWSFREGFYFAFITLSTIGFGDYVVGENGIIRLSWWTPTTMMGNREVPTEVGYF